MTKRTGVRYKEAFKLRLDGFTIAEVARRLCVSRQYIQELLSPPPFIREKVVTSAKGRCRDCNLWVGHSGHVHHVGVTGLTKEEYGDIKNLVLLCASCHRIAHGGRRGPYIPKALQRTSRLKNPRNTKRNLNGND